METFLFLFLVLVRRNSGLHAHEEEAWRWLRIAAAAQAQSVVTTDYDPLMHACLSGRRWDGGPAESGWDRQGV